MKKIFTLFSLLILSTMAMMAQSGVYFVDAQEGGNEVADGSVVNVSDTIMIKNNGEWVVQLPSGLYVTNSSNDGQYVRVQCEITELTNGALQICFPMNCVSYPEEGLYTTPQGGLAANQTQTLQSEWIPTGYGKCSVIYTIQYMERKGTSPFYTYTYTGDGPTVTVNYTWADPAGVKSVETNKQISKTEYYDLTGKQISNPSKGVYVKRTINTTGNVETSKVVIK